MFAQKNRISKQKEFENIFKNGKTIKSGFFKIVFLKNNLNFNRFAIVVNKKVNKNAVIRNKIKRKIRNEIDFLSPNNKSLDIIIIIFPGFLEIVNLKNDIKKIFIKINLY